MHQWIHVNTYSRVLSAKAKHAKWNASEVVAEANREDGACDHVLREFGRVLPPNHVYGAPITELTAKLDEWAAGTPDSRGRAARKDAVCLLSGVFSAPNSISEEAWSSFRDDAVAWLQDKYGDRLQTVVEHRDEDHPHCHFYVVPRPGEKIEAIHEGKRAERDFVAAGGPKKGTNKVFREAMRGFQDEYFESVAMRHGMTRIGPGRRRLSRAEAMQEKQQAKAVALSISTSEALQQDAQEHVQRAKKQAAKVLKDADAKGFEQGFERGIADTEKLPLWKRVKLFLGAVAKERDALKDQVDELGQKLTQERSARRSLADKAKGWYDAGKAAVTRVKELEPALRKALEQAEDGRAARKQADDMFDDLKDAQDLAKHWQATAEAHMPKQQPVMHVPGKKPRLTQGIEVGLGD